MDFNVKAVFKDERFVVDLAAGEDGRFEGQRVPLQEFSFSDRSMGTARFDSLRECCNYSSA